MHEFTHLAQEALQKAQEIKMQGRHLELTSLHLAAGLLRAAYDFLEPSLGDAGINAIAFELMERRKLERLAPESDVEAEGKLIAGASLMLWIGVIVLGRMIPYVGTG